MADISVTAANVLAASTATTANVVAGETITAGQVVYKSTTTTEHMKAVNTSEAAAKAVGIALNGASDGQPLTIAKAGGLNPGGTVAVGVVYAVSGTAGGIAPITDVTAGDYVTTLGIGTSASNINVNIQISDVAEA